MYVLIQPVGRKEFVERTFPQAYDVLVYQEGGHYYAKDRNGNVICVDSPTACIQEAVDALTPNRNWIETVLIRSGNYVINGTIYLDSYTRIIAHDAYLKLGDQVNKAMISNRDQTNGNIYITIEGGIYDGNRANNPNVPRAIIQFYRGDFYVVKDTVIKNSAAYGLAYDGGGTLRAFRNYFRESLGGVVISGWDHLFMHNYYSVNEYADIFNVSDTSTFIGEYFGSAAKFNVLLAGARYNLFVGCNINDSSYNNIRFDKLDPRVPIYNVFIGNKLNQWLNKEADNTYDMVLVLYGTNNALIGNTILSGTTTRRPRYLINEISSPNYFIENILWGNYGTAPVNLSGLSPVYKFRGLILSENAGVATLPANSTRVTVQHNMGIKPNKILLTPGANIRVWYENVTNTSFDIVTDTAPTSDVYISWRAEL